jgi:ferritin-like metal-binding protein YciE
MNLFSSVEFNNFEDLFFDQIEDLYDAEKRLTKALPLMAGAAKSPELKRSFEQHLIETEGQVRRLEEIFRLLGRTPKRETCEAMKGLIKEGDEIVKATGDPDVKDAALIAAAQRVEHYEISGYGTARTFALHLGHEEAASLLEETLREEKKTDQLLTDLAERSINIRAQV